MFRRDDYDFMARAIQLAKQGCYSTDPNPNVGCVLVKHNKIIAEGWHQRAGQNHAELEALKQVNEVDVAGATAYVTLEPCSHFGKTPPCCDALLAAGIKRVVVAMQDPNPLVAGRGLARLKGAGVSVACGLLAEDAAQLNRGFLTRMQTGLPWVVSKMAMSLDGRTAMASGESQWITSASARQDVHRLRAASSAILTGINTVIADDCSLTARLDRPVDILQPLRVILDSSLKMPCTAKLASLPGRSLIFTCSADKQKQQQLQQSGFEIFVLPADQKKRVDLQAVMVLLGELQVNQLLVEAGPTLNGALLSAKLVDDWVVYMAPTILGHEGRGLFTLPELQLMQDKVNLKMKHVQHMGQDLKLTFAVDK